MVRRFSDGVAESVRMRQAPASRRSLSNKLVTDRLREALPSGPPKQGGSPNQFDPARRARSASIVHKAATPSAPEPVKRPVLTRAQTLHRSPAPSQIAKPPPLATPPQVPWDPFASDGSDDEEAIIQPQPRRAELPASVTSAPAVALVPPPSQAQEAQAFVTTATAKGALHVPAPSLISAFSAYSAPATASGPAPAGIGLAERISLAERRPNPLLACAARARHSSISPSTSASSASPPARHSNKPSLLVASERERGRSPPASASQVLQQMIIAPPAIPSPPVLPTGASWSDVNRSPSRPNPLLKTASNSSRSPSMGPKDGTAGTPATPVQGKRRPSGFDNGNDDEDDEASASRRVASRKSRRSKQDVEEAGVSVLAEPAAFLQSLFTRAATTPEPPLQRKACPSTWNDQDLEAQGAKEKNPRASSRKKNPLLPAERQDPLSARASLAAAPAPAPAAKKRPVPAPLTQMTPSPPVPAKAGSLGKPSAAALPANVFGRAVEKVLPSAPASKAPQTAVASHLCFPAEMPHCHSEVSESSAGTHCDSSDEENFRQKGNHGKDERAGDAKESQQRKCPSFTEHQFFEDSPLPAMEAAKSLKVMREKQAAAMAEASAVKPEVVKKGPICDKWGECQVKPRKGEIADAGPSKGLAVCISSQWPAASESIPYKARPAPAPPPRLATFVRLPRTREMEKMAAKKTIIRRTDADELLQTLKGQGALGSPHWPTSWAAAWAFVRWHIPNLLIAAALVPSVFFAVPSTEVWFIGVPPLLILPIYTWFRLARWDRQLMATADHALLSEAKEQLRAPLGWGDNGALFATNLGAAFQALNVQQHELLLARGGRRFLPRRVYLFAFLFVAMLIALRFAVSLQRTAQISTAVLTVIVFILIVLDPCQVRSKAGELDDRIEVIEAAVNTMLDSLRPLLGNDNWASRSPRSESAAFPGLPVPSPSATQAPTKAGKRFTSQRFFSVRLVTAEKQTVRAVLHLPASSESDTLSRSKFSVYSPLAKFGICTNEFLESVSATVLGQSAAGSIDNAFSFSPEDPSSGFLTTWVASQISGHQRSRQRQRSDDEFSTSLASVSTSSTMRSGRANQVDEAALQLALAAVTALSRRRKEPLEAFRVNGPGRTVVPPKSVEDEPCLVITMLQGRLKYITRNEDVHGVLRNPNELRRLFQRQEEQRGGLLSLAYRGGLPSPDSDQACIDSPRSSMSGGSTPRGAVSDEEELAGDQQGRPKTPSSPARYAKIKDLSAPRHLAVLFDSYDERDNCLRLLHDSGIVSPSSEAGNVAVPTHQAELVKDKQQWGVVGAASGAISGIAKILSA